MRKFKFAVLGTQKLALRCSDALLEKGNCLMLINLKKEYRPLNSLNYEDYAEKKCIPYYEVKNINSLEARALLNEFHPDYILSAFPQIIKREVLEIPKQFVIGTHPANLPYNRGRHTLHWHIALGIYKTKLSFFRMGEGIDDGDVISQYPFRIGENDTIDDANEKMCQAGYRGTKILLGKLK